MPFHIRHLMVYLCAALLAMAPGLAWGAVADGTSATAGVASTLISGNGQGNADIINLGAFLFPFILGAFSALAAGMILLTKTVRGIMRTMRTDTSGKCKFYSSRDDGAKTIKFMLTIFLFGLALWFLVYDIDGRSIIAFIIGTILAVTTGRKLHLKWAHYFFLTLTRSIKRNESFKKIYNENPTTKEIINSISRFMSAVLLTGLVFSLFVKVEILALIGAILGPFLAVLATTLLHEKWTKQERRQRLFNTLVATKKYALSHNRAQALNEVKLEFNEKFVVEAWEKFVDYMERPEEMREQKQGDDLYNELLESMKTALGDRSKDIERSFAPQAHLNLEKLDANLKTLLLKVLGGEEPIAIRNSKQIKAEALYRQGERFRDGVGVPKNRKKAIMLFREASDRGFAKAKNALGEMRLYGEGVKKDERKAHAFFEDAAALGLPEAQNHLGVMYADGRVVDQCLEKAEELFLQAARKRLPVAQYNLKLMHIRGESAGKSVSEKVDDLFTDAAHEGFADAQYLMGLIGEKFDALKGEEYLPRATVKEKLEKILTQGGEQGRENVDATPLHSTTALKNWWGRLEWYRYAAVQGHKKALKRIKKCAYESEYTAQYYLGLMYLHGDGVEKDLKKSYQWFSLSEDSGREMFQGMAEKVAGEKMSKEQIATAREEAEKWRQRKSAELDALKAAASQGDAKAQYELGNRHLDGKGVEKSIEKATNLIKSAAEGSYAVAQNTVGSELFDAVNLIKLVAKIQGHGKVQGLLEESINAIKEADSKPDFRMKNDLGIMLLEGADVTNAKAIDQKMKEAIGWLEKTAYQGDIYVQYNLAQIYRNGEMPDMDHTESLKEAYTWLILAARGGHEQILKAKEELAKELSDEIRAAAEAEAKKRAAEIDNPR